MRHWVFDLDGTLVDSFDYFLNFVRQIFSDKGVDFLPHLQIECLGSAALPFLAKHLGDGAAKQELLKLRAQSLIDAEFIEPFPGIIQHLEALQTAGSQMAIWTNRDLQTTLCVLEATGLQRFMGKVVSGNCVAHHKPHPVGMQVLLEHFDCAPEEVTMVGDHEFDMLGGKAAGVRTLRAAWHRHAPPTHCALADGLVPTVAELSRWF